MLGRRVGQSVACCRGGTQRQQALLPRGPGADALCAPGPGPRPMLSEEGAGRPFGGPCERMRASGGGQARAKGRACLPALAAPSTQQAGGFPARRGCRNPCGAPPPAGVGRGEEAHWCQSLQGSSCCHEDFIHFHPHGRQAAHGKRHMHAPLRLPAPRICGSTPPPPGGPSTPCNRHARASSRRRMDSRTPPPFRARAAHDHFAAWGLKVLIACSLHAHGRDGRGHLHGLACTVTNPTKATRTTHIEEVLDCEREALEGPRRGAFNKQRGVDKRVERVGSPLSSRTPSWGRCSGVSCRGLHGGSTCGWRGR